MDQCILIFFLVQSFCSFPALIVIWLRTGVLWTSGTEYFEAGALGCTFDIGVFALCFAQDTSVSDLLLETAVFCDEPK